MKPLDKNPANYAPLTPVVFLFRSADVYPDKLSVIYNDLRYTWAHNGGALPAAGLRPAKARRRQERHRGGDAAECPGHVRCPFRRPMVGAVLNTINVRLDAETIGFMLDHGEAKVLLIDRQYSGGSEESARN